MILQALYELAEREHLMKDPDYKPERIAWLVRVDRDGQFLGFEDTRRIPPAEGSRKPKPVAKWFSVPREKARQSGDRAFFLFDKAEYVFGIDPSGGRPAGQLRSRFDLFRERVNDCLNATKDEGVRAVHLFLEAFAKERQSVVLPQDCASNDLFAFVYAPDLDRLVAERPKVREYWRGVRTVRGEGPTRRCLVSGLEFNGDVGNFPPIKKVPGGTTSGVGLVSFNSTAFESYGWSGNENAPISRDAAEACSTALNRLLNSAYPDPDQEGQTLPKWNLRLSADTVVCFWSAEQGGDELCGIFADLLEGNPQAVGEIYRSVWRGVAPNVKDPSQFYALTLSGSQGRAIVRDWFESTVGVVARNLAAHFADLDIVRNVPKPKEHDLPAQIPLSVLLQSLAPLGDTERIPPHLAGEIVEAALGGTPYPLSILQRAVERARAEIGKVEWSDLNRRDGRAALIKAVLNRRKRRFPETTSYEEVKRNMDPKNMSSGYLLGRLMAVAERMQQAALGERNASVVDRFFSGASATPRAVFPRLLKNLRHHARKAKDDEQSAKTAGWLERQVDDIVANLSDFPPYLDLEQQGLFVLGYHHERHWLWSSKEERDKAQSEA